MKKKLTMGSLFDGSGAFPLGGILSGIDPVWSSEIEPFPVLVTHRRLPQMKHYGDVSTLSGKDLEPVDIITFGSPCQDLSIAGKRAGIQEGKRSNLFFEAIRIIKEMREATNGEKPRYCVWENVPGAFSSNRGEDFRAVLEAVIGVKNEGIQVPAPENHRWPKADVYLGDGWSVAYRVLDAQYWGVPQRRARIYLVADFNGPCAGEILFKSEGVSGYTPQGFRTWQGAPKGAETSAGEAGTGPDAGSRGDICVNPQGNSGVSVTEEVTDTLIAQDHGNHPAVLQAAGFSTEHSAKARSIGYEEEKAPTLRAGVVPAAMMFDNHPQDCRYDGPMEHCPALTARYGTGGNNQPLVAEPSPEAVGFDRYNGSVTGDVAHTLDTGAGNTVPMVFEDLKSYGIGKPAFTSGEKANFGFAVNKEVAPTLQASGPDAVAKPEMKAYGVCSKSSHAMLSDNPHSGFYEAKTSRTLDQGGGNPTCNQGGICIVAPEDGHYSASKNSFFMSVAKEQANTLVATDYKDPPILNDTPNDEPVYIVRRLTPIECARLQGFPDWWCDGLADPEPSEEEVAFWLNVWNIWQSVNGKKPKTEKQVRKWLAAPYTDSAAYKMWGNGCAEPIVYFVMSGIAWAAGKEAP